MKQLAPLLLLAACGVPPDLGTPYITPLDVNCQNAVWEPVAFEQLPESVQRAAAASELVWDLSSDGRDAPIVGPTATFLVSHNDERNTLERLVVGDDVNCPDTEQFQLHHFGYFCTEHVAGSDSTGLRRVIEIGGEERIHVAVGLPPEKMLVDDVLEEEWRRIVQEEHEMPAEDFDLQGISIINQLIQKDMIWGMSAVIATREHAAALTLDGGDATLRE